MDRHSSLQKIDAIAVFPLLSLSTNVLKLLIFYAFS
jgi:hypothetical protein